MTTEHLLIKRYKCIAPIPFQPFPDMYNVGDIFTDNGKTAVLNQKGDPVCVVEWDKYTHLFQPLPWYAEREVSDMPKYVKTCGGDVYKHRYKRDYFGLYFNENVNGFDIGWLLVDDEYCIYEPATFTEYNEWKQSNKTS